MRRVLSLEGHVRQGVGDGKEGRKQGLRGRDSTLGGLIAYNVGWADRPNMTVPPTLLGLLRRPNLSYSWALQANCTKARWGFRGYNGNPRKWSIRHVSRIARNGSFAHGSL